MYLAFFGLTQKPFNMTPDPAFLYLSDQHREALAGLTYGILDKKGFLVLSGTAGAGKTTLIAWTLKKLPVAKVRSSVILNATLTPSEFLEAAMIDFGIPTVPSSKAQRLRIFQNFLLQGHREGKVTALIIDEAHKLSPEVLEEIRLLGNFEISDEKLLQVVLIGQSELDQLLNRPDLWQFKQRISVRLALQPLNAREIGDYIAHRWEVAGAQSPVPFSSESISAIATMSRGIPRLINSLCDNSLVEAFAETCTSVSAEHVRRAAEGLLLEAPMSAAAPVAEVQREVTIVRQPPPPLPIPVADPPAIVKTLPVPKLTLLGAREKETPKTGMFARWAGRLRSG